MLFSYQKKNAEYVQQFYEVQSKMTDTLQRISQTKKKIREVRTSAQDLHKNGNIEKAINEHFVHLHGLLQNIEKRLIDKLYEQRDNLTKNLEDLKKRLDAQENKLQAALTMTLNANNLSERINLKDVVTKMLKLANEAHCYLVQDPIIDNSNITFHPDQSIKSALENHCKLVIPEISGYCLQTEDNLPEDYKIEPLVKRPHDNSMCSELSTMRKASSCRSVYSQRSEILNETEAEIRNGDTLIPVKICNVENPSSFYVCKVSHLNKIFELEEMLNNYANKNHQVPREVEQNGLYAVKHQVTNRWYRGRVTFPEKSERYEVFNIDKGSVEHNVPKQQLRCIPEHLTSMGPMVMHCALYNIMPKNGQWSNEACEAISKYQAFNETVKMHVENSKGNIYYVDLLVENSKRIAGSYTSSIRDALIFIGLGVFHSSHQLLRSTPYAVRRYFLEELAINYFHNVKVTHMESPDCIYVQKIDENFVYLQKMMIDINAYYKDKIKSDDGIIHVPEIGLTCAAEDTDGTWYRAVISKETTESRMVTVTLVDFGRTITVNFDKIRTLHEKFMASTAQAIKTTLADINPVDGEWSQSCKELMSEHFENPYVRVFAYEKTADVTTVNLTTSSGINIAALLVSKGLAISVGPRSSGVVEAPLAPPVMKKSKAKVRNNRTVKKKKQKQATVEKTLNRLCQETNDPFKLRVKILRVKSPDEIYVADPENDKRYSKLITDMQRFYSLNEGHSNDDEWKIGHQCAVYSASDRMFCRGKIVGFNNPKEAQVFLYDLTHTENIPVADLQPLALQFWDTPCYAIKVKLAGLNPCGGSSGWISASCDKLQNLIAENQNCKFFISTLGNLEKDHLEVELWVEQVKIEGPLAPGRIEINSINKMLVHEGMALPIKQYESNAKVLAVELKRQISTKQEKPMNKNRKINGTFQKKEHCNDIDSPQTINSDDELNLCENGFSVEEDETTLCSEEDSLSNNKFKFLPDEKVEQTATQWLPAIPIEDAQFEAMVTNLDDDCRFYIHSIQQSRNHLSYIERTLDEKYRNTVVTPPDLVWEEGDLCIAQYHSNKKWYRGQVREVLENGVTKVEFIDYGNIEICENGTLRKTLALLDIPRQGTHCFIFGLVPNTEDGKWPTIDLDRIHGILVDQICDIFVRERKPDHLEVSLLMKNPKKCDLITFLCDDLKMNVLMDTGSAKLTSEEASDKTNDDTADTTVDEAENDVDVVVDGYIENNEYELIKEQKIIHHVKDDSTEDEEYEAVEKNRPDEIEKTTNDNGREIENDGESRATDTIDNCNDENIEGGDEIENHCENECKEITCIEIDRSKSPKSNTLQTIRDLENTFLRNKDFEEAENNIKCTNPFHEDIISGTMCCTHISDEISINGQVMKDLDVLDAISLPSTGGLTGDEIITSTPHNHSFEANNNQTKSIIIPEDVTLVKAEISLVGLDQFTLHIVGNNSSKILTQQRQHYEKIMAEMQIHAEDQPLLKSFYSGQLCCAKFMDGKWYRSKVVSNESQPYELGHTLNVYFIDYGNSSCVKSEDIRVLKDEWHEAPCMLMHCGLWNVFINPTIDPNESLLRIKEFFESEQYTESKNPRTFYIKIEARYDEFYKIQMYNNEDCTVLTYQPIIDEGLYVQETNLWA
ncbi:RING finger protein 17 isoform X2 [Venturia canescens]|uniref:RING finger protein 17 isoform X2 n=1 Tax=Venturia canescens TaxID=32260 RepID=UPI001C9CFF46|nr:RING finger protein 17 isoform X2 [Venturia canescens]